MFEKHSIVYIYHTTAFFIHSSVNEQLGCFPMLAIVNNAAMNTEVSISFQISAFGCLVGFFFFSNIYTQEWNC